MKFILEIGDCAHATKNGLRLLLDRVVYKQSFKGIDFDIRKCLQAGFQHFEAFIHRKQGFLLRVDQDSHDNFVEKGESALEDVQVAISDRIEGAGINGDVFHAKDLCVKR